MNADVAILARGLIKRFRAGATTVAAVNGVDLQVERGETFGLIGPDGAGKTTLTRVILGLLTRTAGESSVLGRDSMREPYAIRERVGYIAQQFALPADMTVMENLRFFASMHQVGRDEQRQRIPELLEFAGLGPFRDRLAGRLSGGMKKKLALACSLIHEPQVVMLDEPTLGVDPVSRREFWNLLGHLRATRGLTIYICTPYMDEAERCNRVGLMYAGRLVACDTPQGVVRQAPGRLIEFRPAPTGRAVPTGRGAPAGAGPLEQALRLVASLPGVLEVQAYGSRLHVFVDDLQRQGPIQRALAGQGIGCEGMREIQPRMEDAFISLIRAQAVQP